MRRGSKAAGAIGRRQITLIEIILLKIIASTFLFYLM